MSPLKRPAANRWRCLVEGCKVRGIWQDVDVPTGSDGATAGRRAAHLHYIYDHYTPVSATA